MSTRYLEIIAVQSPFTIGKDDNNRVAWSVNFDAHTDGPSDKFEEEIVKVLSDAGLATLGTDTWIGPGVVFPQTGNGPFTAIIPTGGESPDESHNGDVYERLSCQITVRASTYSLGRTRIFAIWRELIGKRNITVAA